MNQLLYSTLRDGTHVVNSIKNIHSFDLDAHDDVIAFAHKDCQTLCDSLFDDLFDTISSRLDPLHLCALQMVKINDLSCWLNVLPLEKDNFDLTAQEFCDALAVRYKSPC